MPRPDAPTLLRDRGTVLRALGLGLAVALGVLGVVLIVRADATKYTQMGAIIMLWGLLLGSFVAYGVRRPTDAYAGAPGVGAELELRSQATEVESAKDVRARREAEARLQEILRQEIREAVNREVGSLRSEISSLRTELLEKVGGQLRLEHIETTRVIGSDLEALQGEIRALKAVARDPQATARGRLDGAVVEREIVNRAVVDQPVPARPTPEILDGGPSRPVGANGSEVDGVLTAGSPANGAAPTNGAAPANGSTNGAAPTDSAVPANGSANGSAKANGSPPQPAPSTVQSPARPVTAPAQSQAPVVPPAQQSTPPIPPPVRPAHPPAAPAQPARSGASGPDSPPSGPQRSADPFADLPRLTPYVDDAPPQSASQPPTSTEPTYVRPPAAPPAPPTYEGRRRRAGEGQAAAGAPRNGSPAPHTAGGPAPRANGSTANGRRGVPAPERDTPGRRRRAEDNDSDNLLARLLERERH